MTKKRNRRTSNTTKWLIYFGLATCFILVIITALILKVVSKKPENIQPPPAYEEAFSKDKDPDQAISEIDRAIYRFLSSEKIPKQNIVLATLEPRQKNIFTWEFTELGVKLADKGDMTLILKTFNGVLSALKPRIIYQKEVVSEKEIVYHVYVDEFYTHKIKFFIDNTPVEAVISKSPKIAIIIDDLGYDPFILKNLEEIDFPLTLSLLPSAPYEKEVIALAKRKGWELLLHLPMEPKNYPDTNPGPDALLMDMTDVQISKRIDKYLEELPEAKGVNNHMGSAFTEHEEKMSVVLREIKKQKLFYIDSRTSVKTTGFQTAQKMGIPTANRNVFLDNDLSSEAIQMQLDRLIEIAKHFDQAVGIGHPHHQTIEILKKYFSSSLDPIQAVKASEIVH
jgi:polysaccharide deacetylase 2 family uncharacterized protein YibQ